MEIVYLYWTKRNLPPSAFSHNLPNCPSVPRKRIIGQGLRLRVPSARKSMSFWCPVASHQQFLVDRWREIR
jgi:hypothetical protein